MSKKLLCILFLFLPQIAFAQFSIQSLSQISYGKLPGATRSVELPTYYNHLSIEYRLNSFLSDELSLLVGARLQSFFSPELNSPSFDESYNKFSQRYVEASWRWVNIRAGNSFAIIGRGMVLRSFELPGFLYEDPQLRQRHGVIRDVDGWKISLSPGPFEVMAISGKPVDPLRTPIDKSRRGGEVRGGQASVRLPGNVQVGGAYLEFRERQKVPLATRFLQFSLKPVLSTLGIPDFDADFYTEYATVQGRNGFGKFDADHPYAFYFSGTLAYSAWGASFEYKDYRDFAFGINDPPSLVRENAEVLLNRATHVLLAEAERGIQTEISFAPAAAWRITANYSNSKNDLGVNSPATRYHEALLTVEWFGENLTTKIFVDGGRDDLLFEKDRFTSGGAADYHFTNGLTFGFDIQGQRMHRLDYEFTNYYSALRLGGWKNLSLSVQMERSSDPFETDDLTTKRKKIWTGIGIGWKPASQIDLQFFGGKRRGGNACDHGYCLQVQPFSGVELRMQTNW